MSERSTQFVTWPVCVLSILYILPVEANYFSKHRIKLHLSFWIGLAGVCNNENICICVYVHITLNKIYFFNIFTLNPDFITKLAILDKI